MSNIDPTVPTYATATTASVRDNFGIAKTEIEALQATIDALPSTLEGSFLPLTGGAMTGPFTAPIIVGVGTGTPMLTINGASGSGEGIQWQTGGNNRWRMITDPSDNLALYAYGPSGNYIGTAMQINNDLQSMWFNAALQLFATNATATNSVTGLYSHSVNTGSHAAAGVRFNYNSSSFESGFDVGCTWLSIFDPASYPSLVNVTFMGEWRSVQSPNDAASPHVWNTTVAEWNIVNRGRDAGWQRDRSTGNPTGGLLMVAESNTPGATTGGEGKNATFAYTVGPSGSPNSTGFPVKFYNCFLVEPNAAVGLTGRAIYVTGDITATPSQYPYGPFQVDGTWLHGFDHTLATYMDSHASVMRMGQGLAWVTGTTVSPIATAMITGFGTGSDVSLQLVTAGSGYTQTSGNLVVGNGSAMTALYVNGVAGVAGNGVYWATAGVNRWQLGTDASANMWLYAYNSGGSYLGAMIGFGSAPMGIYVNANVGFNGTAPIAKPTGVAVTVAAIHAALVSYGLIAP